jgi:integrase/recombinase XerD
MLKAAEHPRDRAFLAVAASTGARRGELLNLRIRDVHIEPYGYTLILTGKTGTHPSPPIVRDFAKILRIWLEHHPQRNNPEAPLWPRLRAGAWGDKGTPIGRVQAHNIVKNAAKAANLERNIHLHMFRHTENTLLTKRHVPAASEKTTWMEPAKHHPSDL